MGVDLRLLPLISPTSWSAHDMVGIGRNYELWGAIGKLPQHPIAEPLWCFLATNPNGGDAMYGTIEEDPYGQPLKFVYSQDLLSLRDSASVRDSWKARAAFAYLAELPLNWPIVLYWH